MVTVFYANLVYGQYPLFPRQSKVPDEVYQGGYAYVSQGASVLDKQGWYRLDFTPVLDEDVPPELKAWVLIMDL